MTEGFREVKTIDDMNVLDKETQRELLAAALLIEKAMAKCKAFGDDTDRYFSVSTSGGNSAIIGYTISCISRSHTDIYTLYKMDDDIVEHYYTGDRNEHND